MSQDLTKVGTAIINLAAHYNEKATLKELAFLSHVSKHFQWRRYGNSSLGFRADFIIKVNLT